MATLKEIETEWAEDAIIKEGDLAREALRIPSLHSKWWVKLNKERRELHGLSVNMERVESTLEDYYQRTITVEEMQKLGYSELPDKKVLRTDLPKVISTNRKMIEAKLSYGLQLDKVKFVEDIIKSIHNRSFIIRDAIEFKKFQAGEG